MPDDKTDTNKANLRNAANKAAEEFSEFNTEQPTGIFTIGIGGGKIYFYIRDEKAAELVPETYEGYDCVAKILKEIPKTY